MIATNDVAPARTAQKGDGEQRRHHHHLRASPASSASTEAAHRTKTLFSASLRDNATALCPKAARRLLAWHAELVAEDRLTGGRNTREVVRIGETVRHTRGSGAGFAARVLTFLESIGFAHAPRYLGVDERDRDILTFIPGCTTDHPSQRGHGAYGMGGRILRELHDATDGHALAGTQECVIHGDPGPFNTIFRQGQPVALIDWDSCRPGRRLEDLAYMSWTWCIQSAGNVPIEHQAEHLRELRDGYGSVETELLIDMMLLRQAEIAASEAANARNLALDRVRRQSAEEAVAWAENDSALVRGNRTTLLAALLR